MCIYIYGSDGANMQDTCVRCNLQRCRFNHHTEDRDVSNSMTDVGDSIVTNSRRDLRWGWGWFNIEDHYSGRQMDWLLEVVVFIIFIEGTRICWELWYVVGLYSRRILKHHLEHHYRHLGHLGSFLKYVERPVKNHWCPREKSWIWHDDLLPSYLYPHVEGHFDHLWPVPSRNDLMFKS